MHITDDDLAGRVRIQQNKQGKKRFVVVAPCNEIEEKFAGYVQKIAVMVSEDVRERTSSAWIGFILLSGYVSLSLCNQDIENFILTDGKKVAVYIYLATFRSEVRAMAQHLLSLWNKGDIEMPKEYPYTLQETKDDFIK